MKKHYTLYIVIAVFAIAIFVVLSLVSNSTQYAKYDGTQDFSLEYGLYRFPSPTIPMSYTIRIDENGLLVREYIDVARYGDDFNAKTRQLSYDELASLIDVIHANGFFRMSEDLDGNSNITDQDSRNLAVTYNGKTHKSYGYNTRNRRYLAICNYIETLAEFPE